MTEFYYIILKGINDYKAFLRKNLSSKESAAKIRDLGIKRKYIKNADVLKLYEIGLKIIDELSQMIGNTKREKLANFYFGTEDFLHYMQGLFAEYKLENGNIVNIKKEASRALVTAIQLIHKLDDQITDHALLQIEQCGRVIVKYGNAEQKKIFFEAVCQNGVAKNLTHCLDDLPASS